MERETELYLVKRINDLEGLLHRTAGRLQLLDIENGTLKKALEQKDNSTKEYVKAKAFDELVKLLHISAVGIDKKKEYRIVSPKHAKEVFIDLPIDIETFKLFWEALTCDKRD